VATGPWIPNIVEPHYEDILTKQLALNRQTWAALQQPGVREESRLGLDFSYNAPSREAAEKLRFLLQKETDYDVKVESSGSFLHRRWRVEGTTQETAVSPAILDQWVTWMVTAGQERACDFDGWGTAI
jgi:hypothetical protein